MTRIGARAPRTVHADCGWGCDCATGRARNWAVFPYADLNADQWEYLTGLLMARSGGRCEACGLPFEPGVREPNRHHRRARSMGGTDDPCVNGLANLLLVCAGPAEPAAASDRRTSLHGWIEHHPDDAQARGLLVPWGAYVGDGSRPPEIDVPVTLFSGRRVWLDPHDTRYRGLAAG